MTAHLLTVAAFMIVTFAVQGLSHFVLNKEHYAAQGFLREKTAIAGGILAMVIQGFVVSYLYSQSGEVFDGFGGGLVFALLIGLILWSYIALAEPSKYAVRDVGRWMRVETLASASQFLLFGLVLQPIHAVFA